MSVLNKELREKMKAYMDIQSDETVKKLEDIMNTWRSYSDWDFEKLRELEKKGSIRARKKKIEIESYMQRDCNYAITVADNLTKIIENLEIAYNIQRPARRLKNYYEKMSLIKRKNVLIWLVSSLLRYFKEHNLAVTILPLNITRVHPREIAEGQSVDVEIQFSSEFPLPFEIRIQDKLPNDFKVIRGRTDWEGCIELKNATSCMQYSCRCNKFGLFNLGPVSISFLGLTYNVEGTISDILVTPSSIKLVRKVIPSVATVKQKVKVYIVLANESDQDIFNVTLTGYSEELYDLDYKNIEEFWKCIKKGEQRIIEGYVIPKRAGKFLISKAKATFTNDQRKGVFTIYSDDTILEVKPESSIINYTICPNCGSKMPIEATFCGICGTKLSR